MLSPKAFARLPDFIDTLAGILHPAGLAVSSDVEAYHGDSEPEVVRELAENGDFIVVMAYDQHTADKDAGPIASASWFFKIVERFADIAPKNKVVVAIGNWAYDWRSDGQKGA